MPKKLTSVGELIEDTAQRKRRASEAAFNPRSTDVEPARGVYAAACARIAAEFAPDGYRYAKSGPHCSRTSSDMLFKLHFQSSHYNISGQSVALSMHATVWCERLKRWRVENGSVTRSDSRLAGGQIGNLVENHSWLQWDLADPAIRDDEIASAVAAVRELALPYFAAFEDVPALCRRLADEDLPSLEPAAAFDFLSCYDSLEGARAMLIRFLAQHPLVVGSYRQALRQLQQTENPFSGTGRDIALISVAYDFGDLAQA